MMIAGSWQLTPKPRWQLVTRSIAYDDFWQLTSYQLLNPIPLLARRWFRKLASGLDTVVPKSSLTQSYKTQHRSQYRTGYLGGWWGGGREGVGEKLRLITRRGKGRVSRFFPALFPPTISFSPPSFSPIGPCCYWAVLYTVHCTYSTETVTWGPLWWLGTK